LAPIEHGSATVTVSDLEPGTYAVVVLHDENQNGKMDKTLLGRQKKATASPTMPNRKRLTRSFHEAAFALNTEGRTLTINIHY